MNFPCLIIEVPHQSPAEAYPIFDRADFARIYGDQVSTWLDRQAEALDLEEDQPTPGLECCEANDSTWLQAIGHDLHMVILIESAEEAARGLVMGFNCHQGPRIRTLVSDHAPDLWDAQALHFRSDILGDVEWCFTPEAAKAVYEEDGGWLIENTINGIHAWLVGPGVEVCYPEDADTRTADALAALAHTEDTDNA